MVIQKTPTKIDKIVSLKIGQRGENLATDIKMDVSDWVAIHPDAHYHCLFKRPGEVQVLPVLSSFEDGILTWTVRAWECGVIGVGYLEVRAVDSDTGMVAKSRVIPCSVEDSIIDDEGPIPPEMSWVEEVIEAKNDAEAARDEAQEVVAGAIGSIEAAGEAQVGAVNSAGATQVDAVQDKGEEVLDSIPDDYSALSGNVSALKSAIDAMADTINQDLIPIAYQVLHQSLDGDKVIHEASNWIAYYYRADGVKLFTKIVTKSGNNTDYYQLAFFSSDDTINASTFVGGEKFAVGNSMTELVNITVPTAAVIAVVFCKNDIPDGASIAIEGIKSGNVIEQLNDMTADIETIEDSISTIVEQQHVTLVDVLADITFVEDKYINASGVEYENTTYKHTNKIAVNPGDVITNDASYMRFICAYNDDTVIKAAGTDTAVTSYVVPDGVNGIVVSVLKSGTSRSNNFTRTYTVDMWKTDGQTDAKISISFGGNNCVTATADTLTSGAKIELTDFPLYLKKGVSISFCAKIASFVKLAIGKGYNDYRGSWFEIDATQIRSLYSPDGETVTTLRTVAHELTITDFVNITITVDSDNDATVHFGINTLAGSKVFDFAWNHEFNGTVFVLGNQDMTDVKLSATADDAKRGMWLFGDSYFGVASNRVIGQLINLGYAENVLIDGRAGNNATHAYGDVVALLALGARPKYLVWCIGMNGSAYDNIEKINALKGLADLYGFTLILYRIPTVPERAEANNTINATVEASGLRFVDAKKAVGASDTGVWYAEMLATDGIHPTTTGAQAIAMRICIDVPEIMQYGCNKGVVGSDISGDR